MTYYTPAVEYKSHSHTYSDTNNNNSHPKDKAHYPPGNSATSHPSTYIYSQHNSPSSNYRRCCPANNSWLNNCQYNQSKQTTTPGCRAGIKAYHKHLDRWVWARK